MNIWTVLSKKKVNKRMLERTPVVPNSICGWPGVMESRARLRSPNMSSIRANTNCMTDMSVLATDANRASKLSTGTDRIVLQFDFEQSE